MKKRIALVFGTRPEIIKLSPVIRLLEHSRKPYFMIHTGQHYSFEMDSLFFEQLELPQPQFQLKIPTNVSAQGSLTGPTAFMMTEIEKILTAEKPSTVLVQGDTNSVLAGALATAKLPAIQLGHVEAGLRSYDRNMPEEVNRILTDHMSHYLFAPTPLAKRILLKEGIPAHNITLTGNTIVDAVQENLKIAKRDIDLRDLKLPLEKGFCLMTLHRQESVDDAQRLAAVLEGIGRVAIESKMPVIFPVHPRTLKQLERFGLKIPQQIYPIKPVGFLEFLLLEKNASLILTDSGGVQEEACILGVPCVTLRTTTERPETLKVGANMLAGYNPSRIAGLARRMVRKHRSWKNPFGDGHSAKKILSVIE
ncbi:MAG: UDP-N-acetylglucosamine 2-epimerase (non-hydrolyzing) [Candidatus Omnitrophica bacterium]|nr:UDP-N-acetylglucosamine 2-epimerase (non-hydrolyzing) [Candidatus Omnitrophota bacterium]